MVRHFECGCDHDSRDYLAESWAGLGVRKALRVAMAQAACEGIRENDLLLSLESLSALRSDEGSRGRPKGDWRGQALVRNGLRVNRSRRTSASLCGGCDLIQSLLLAF